MKPQKLWQMLTTGRAFKLSQILGGQQGRGSTLIKFLHWNGGLSCYESDLSPGTERTLIHQ